MMSLSAPIAGRYFSFKMAIIPIFRWGILTPSQLRSLPLFELLAKQFIDCDPIYKDLTDTEMAFNWALDQKPSQILLVGALGTRFDHSLANVHLLRKGMAQGIPCAIMDANNLIMVIDQSTRVRRGPYTHISLLPLSLEVTGITLHGFQYPLQQATLEIGMSLGISNVLLKPEGLIELSSGLLLVVQSKD